MAVLSFPPSGSSRSKCCGTVRPIRIVVPVEREIEALAKPSPNRLLCLELPDKHAEQMG
jgi:hypothetical protein